MVALTVEKTQKKFPLEFLDKKNILYFRKIAESVRFKNINIEVKQEEERGFYFAKDYSFKAQGTFIQFLLFTEKVEELEGIFNIKVINLSKDKASRSRRYDFLKIHIQIETYRYNQDYKEDRGIREIERKLKKNNPKKE